MKLLTTKHGVAHGVFKYLGFIPTTTVNAKEQEIHQITVQSAQ